MKRKHLIDLRKDAGIGQIALAKKIGVTQSAISQLENGTTVKISGDVITGYIKEFGVNAEWIDKGFGEKFQSDKSNRLLRNNTKTNTIETTLSVKYLPLISFVQAGSWMENTDPYEVGDFEDTTPTTANVSNNAYALRVVGDSMQPTIPEGAIIIVDPNRQAENKQIVVVRQNGDTEATVKRLVTEGSKKYLLPDNTQYPAMEMMHDAVLCGVVVKVELDLI